MMQNGSTPPKPAKGTIAHQSHLTSQLCVKNLLFLALYFLRGLGDLAASLVGLDYALDDTDSDGLTHVTECVY